MNGGAESHVGPSEASSTRQLVEKVSINEDSVLITAKDTVSDVQCSFMLLGEWRTTRVEIGDHFRVILTDNRGVFLRWDVVQQYTDVVVVDDDRNLLVMHPDVLLSGSSIAESVSCVRKTVLLARNPGTGGAGSAPAFFGNMLHDLFQTVLVMLSEKSGEVDHMELAMLPEDILRSKTATLYQLDLKSKDALTVLHDAIPMVLDWYNKFFRSSPAPLKRPSSRLSADNVKVTHVQDIEELVWSPCTGLKGKIDATVGIKRPDSEPSIGVMELKTGSSKGSAALSHFAQVSLYTLLLSDRYETTVTDGLLSYIPSTYRRPEVPSGGGESKTENGTKGKAKPYEIPKPHSVFVRSHRGELVGLVMQRNRVAYYLQPTTAFSELPPVLARANELCSRCFVQETCMMQNKLLEGGSVAAMRSDFDQNIYDRHTVHLDQMHAAFYYFWLGILTAEEVEAFKTQNEIWTKSAEERAVSGRCIANLKLVPNDLSGPTQSVSQDVSLNVDGKRVQKFDVMESVENRSIKSTINVGDYVMISVEKVVSDVSDTALSPCSMATWKPALSNGFVSSITKNSVSILLDRNLTAWARKQRFPVDSLLWRIDSQEMLSSFRTAKGNLDTLFTAGADDAHGHLRNLVVNCTAPRFHPLISTQKEQLQQSIADFKKRGMVLNDGQKRALAFCEQAQDYMLLLGMPGTGKSMTLAAIVMQAARQGKKVLLCSHTHSAVDNVLLKLLSFGFSSFARIGRAKNITDARIKPYLVDTYGAKSVEEIEKAFDTPSVIASTCLSVTHPVFSRVTAFDLVVVDEASQILQPICIGPLLFAKPKFVLVGDHHQLPPLLRAKRSSLIEDEANGSTDASGNSPPRKRPRFTGESFDKQNVSLFRRLNDKHPDAVVSLTQQYRMAKPIMEFANSLVYNNQLSCGDERTAEQCLYVEPDDYSKLPKWLSAVLDPAKHLIFINMDPNTGVVDAALPPGTQDYKLETQAKGGVDPEGSRKNVDELNIITKAIRALCKAGVTARDITVLSPFRAQVELFRAHFRKRNVSLGLRDVSLFTIDQYQGRDNDCVIVSFVRAGNDARVGPLLRDWRRLNVAITRAKKKLVLVGSRRTLASGGKFLSSMLDFVKDATVSPFDVSSS